jgi:subtilisin family serine protease
LTTDRDDPALREAVQYARSRDVVLVAAAGNRYEAGNPRTYPASYEGVLGVGGIQPDGARVPTSQTGPHVDLVAPGADVTAAARGGGHARYAGTSFAAAFVAGTAALVRQYHPALTADQVAERIIATADSLGPNPRSDAGASFQPGPRDGEPGSPAPAGGPGGAGIVNPYRAVTASLDGRQRAAAGPVVRRTPDAAARRAAATAASTRRTGYRWAIAGAGTLVLLLLIASARHHRARREQA